MEDNDYGITDDVETCGINEMFGGRFGLSTTGQDQLGYKHHWTYLLKMKLERIKGRLFHKAYSGAWYLFMSGRDGYVFYEHRP